MWIVTSQGSAEQWAEGGREGGRDRGGETYHMMLAEPNIFMTIAPNLENSAHIAGEIMAGDPTWRVHCQPLYV